jgi:O-antigen ligase
LKLRATTPSRLSLAPRGILGQLLILAGMLYFLSWAIVNMPGAVPMVLVLGILAVVTWTLHPTSAVYTLAVICPFGMSYRVMGLQGIEPLDGVLLVALAVATITLLEGRSKADRFGVPVGKFLLGFWLLMICWNSVTFALGPANEGLWRDTGRNIWYLYRGVWKDFVVFPVVVLCLTDRSAARRTVAITVAVTALMSAYAIGLSWQTHEPPTGPFGSKNGLAGFLILILPFALARVFLEKKLAPRLLYAGAALFMFRALWLTTSRGGFVGFMVSLAPFLFLVPPKRLMAAGAAGVLVVLIFIGMKGNILNRPNFQRYLTLSSFSEQSNYQWREEQWRLFMARIARRPWLGTGSEVVEALQEEGRLPTAHNGYLGMALRAGIPGAAMWAVILAGMGILSLKSALQKGDLEERVFWLGTSGLVLAWMTHSLVDNVLLMSEAQRVFWLVTGLALVETSGAGGRSVEVRKGAEALA